MTYKIAERFKSIQGEGVYTGCPMAFIRFVGCSVGKRICQHCDTDFEKVGETWRGGGEFEGRDLLIWTRPLQHVCLTGGEPLDQDLRPFVTSFLGSLVEGDRNKMFHIETSGTVPIPAYLKGRLGDGTSTSDTARRSNMWICVSPKPGFLEEVVMEADEVKVIVPGLGEMTDSLIKLLNVRGPEDMTQGEWRHALRWPTLDDAVRWAAAGKTVFLQPRNGKFDIDKQNLLYVQDVIKDHPELRLSVQMHKILKVQ